MALVIIRCMNCRNVTRLGEFPGDPGYGYGPDGYLPCDRTATTCSNCHPEFDGLSERTVKAKQKAMGLR